MLLPSLGTLLYFPSVQRTGHAATNQTLCYITTGCSRMSYLVLKHNPVPLACFRRDIYCWSYNSSSPAAARKSQGAIKWPFLFLAAWRRHKQSSHQLRSQTGNFLPRRHSLRVPAMAEDVDFEVVMFTRSRVCISLCPRFAWALLEGTDRPSRCAAARPNGLGATSREQQRMGQHRIALDNAERRSGGG